MERRVRGSVINGYMGYVKMKWGKEGLDQCLNGLGLEEGFEDGKYYHAQISENILRWISREKGDEDLIDVGKYVVKNLGILKWLVRFADVRTVAEKFPSNYSEIYTSGHVEIDTGNPDEILVKLFDVCYIKETCLSWQGVCEGALEMTKTAGTVKETKCRVDGDDYCEFTVTLGHGPDT